MMYIRWILLLCGWQTLLYSSNSVVSCAVHVGNVSWMLFQEGRSSNFGLRRGVGKAAHTSNNPHVKCTGVYCAWIVNNAVISRLYWVQHPGSWILSWTLTLIIQLHSKLLVTVRVTSADCKWSTRHLMTPHIARAINT